MDDKQDKDKARDDKPTPAKNVILVSQSTPVVLEGVARECVAILPGLGHYDTDSTSDSEGDSSETESVSCAHSFRLYTLCS